MKKVLITGHQGYIGAVMVPYFLKKGLQVVGLDTGYFNGCELFPLSTDLDEIRKDVRRVDEKDFEGVDAVCHLAALSNDPMGALSPRITEDINYTATVHLARCAKEAGVRKFLFSSSCSIYGVADENALTEEAQMDPRTAYAKAKAASEKAIFQMASDRFEVCSLRNGTAYGVSPMHRTDLVLNNLVGWAFLTGKIRIMSDGTPWRPVVHIEDICNAFWAAVEADEGKINGQAFNVGQNTENYQIRDMADCIQEVLPDTQIHYSHEHGSDSRTYNVNFDKINTFLPGFNPTWNLREATRELYQAYQQNGLQMEDFDGRRFVRLKQIRHLMETRAIDGQLYWIR